MCFRKVLQNYILYFPLNLSFNVIRTVATQISKLGKHGPTLLILRISFFTPLHPHPSFGLKCHLIVTIPLGKPENYEIDR